MSWGSELVAAADPGGATVRPSDWTGAGLSDKDTPESCMVLEIILRLYEADKCHRRVYQCLKQLSVDHFKCVLSVPLLHIHTIWPDNQMLKIQAYEGAA